jgi:hypothetical protein
MTGQVKEEVLLRQGELGVRVVAGALRFEPLLLREDELLAAPATLRGVGPRGPFALALERGTLGFTCCGVPVVYHRLAAGRAPSVALGWADGRREELAGAALGRAATAAVHARAGALERIDVHVAPGRPPRA